MKEMLPGIWRVPPTEEPLSSDVFIVEGEKRYYVFDVGTGADALEAIRSLQKPVVVILSHFHQDHTGNMAHLQPERLLCGVRTRKHLGWGEAVESMLEIADGIFIRVQPCVSPHAPGCLIMTVNDTYTFLGDLCYAHPGKGQGEEKGMLNTLKKLNTHYFIASHRTQSPVEEKQKAIDDIRQHFGI